MAIKKLLFGVTLIASLVCNVSCINCFYCNSANNSACLDFTQFSDEARSRLIPIVNCDVASQVPVDFFCRKIVQTIFHTNREAEVRVTRGCGWVRNQNDMPCYRADSRDHLETACQCFSDHCNSADSADPASSVLLFLGFAAVLYFYR